MVDHVSREVGEYERARRLAEGDGLRRSAMRGALHVTNGDSAANTLLETTLVKRVLPWRDALHEGPVPAVSQSELRRIRASFLADDAPSDFATISRWLEERDRTLDGNGDHEYVLWFEADLYDQLQLIQVLAQLEEQDVEPERITLICIGEHLGIAHFGGLGELHAEQLERVAAGAAIQLSPSALELARAAWTALRADNPSGLAVLARTHHPELRFLGETIDRLSREYPSNRDGLSLTERRILAAVREEPSTAGAAFMRVAAREARPFLGDSLFFRITRRLASARTSLLATRTGQIDASTELRLTDAGQRVLDGADDHVRLNGIDRWIGGVHLAGAEARLRWNEGTETIVAS
jgi:hypothetical protein